jgi:hypothetical protein
MGTETHLFIHLVASVCKIEYMVIAHYRNIANHMSKNILQGDAANNPCDWKPSLLDVKKATTTSSIFLKYAIWMTNISVKQEQGCDYKTIEP